LSLDASFPLSNGLKLKGVVRDANKRVTAEDTCYTSFCGELCVPGYTSASTMNGQVGGLGEATACQEHSVQSLCCPSGKFTGRCEWYGWQGQGLSCSESCAQGDDMIAKNTNHICKSIPPSMTRDQTNLSILDNYPEQHFFEDQTCLYRSRENTRIHEISSLTIVRFVSKLVLRSKVPESQPPSAFPPTPPPSCYHQARQNTPHPPQHDAHQPVTRHQRPRTSKRSVPPSK